MHEIKIPLKEANLYGFLQVPAKAMGLVLFVHGSGSGRHSPRNQYVAGVLNGGNIATLLFDLLTEKEEIVDSQTANLRFDIPFLTKRVVQVIEWVKNKQNLPIGLFGASTGAAAALKASVANSQVKAVVSRGGRPDLAKEDLPKVQVPTLLIVGENDPEVIKLNEVAKKQMPAKVELIIVPGATHLFEEEGTLEQVAQEALDFFTRIFRAK